MFDWGYWDDFETLQRHRQRWEKMHTRGAAFFVLLVGALGFGVLPLIVITCWDVLVEHEQMDAFVFALSALFWLLDGLFWGAVMWHVSEKRYMRAKMQQDSINGSQPE
ncbi:MAG: hypothetical protein P4K86_04035 [Terracidiphilus sp.]|nr:hypothetical protein [Terracidiphilus sp.]MDR3777346.1 hypothetical protein [Terracidiphilus sp.]